MKERLQVAKSDTSRSMSYMGICKLGDTHRRIDIKIYPKESYGFALLYFTGSDHFNRSMRLYAKKQGMSMSDHGLTYVNRVNGEKVSKGKEIKCETEEEIFKLFGLDYKEPSERDI